MNSLDEPVASDQLRLLVEMGDDYTPSARVTAALNELSAALETDDEDVDGFTYLKYELKMRSFSFDSLKLGDGGPLRGPSGFFKGVDG